MIKIIKISMRGQQAPNKGSEKKIKNEITEEQKREIKDAYAPFEETLGFDPKNEEVGRILEQVGNKGKNPYGFEDFVDLMIEKPNKDPKVEMEKAFKILCEDGKDKITLKSLKKICSYINGIYQLNSTINLKSIQTLYLEL